ncbi:MFS transporter [Hydrogenophaga sp.]|uniref:AmpG family muropeptide MFS transporter n=1 Tax=Hydrogenophaga sp. TaxID=1904254 RepID=UPI00271EE9EB|nr:MFS transporter [Hydrogenophaga sp.]MDO8905071.1 MFS transporter [Hydrogenophaga sp.]
MSPPTSSAVADNSPNAPVAGIEGEPNSQPARPSWRETLRSLWDRRVLAMLFLGFTAGLPILLIFSSLSLWLVEAGVERRAVTFFSWAALGYSFKFIWAPLVDRLPLPLLTRWLGRRRAYLLLSQVGVISAIVGMASTDPASGGASLTAMALFAVMLGFMSATQDIVIDAYRIEIAPPEQQGVLSSAYIAGYRIGMIVAGAGALFLAAHWGSARDVYVYTAWQQAYLVMALAMGVGVITTFLVREPVVAEREPEPSGAHARLLAVFVCAVLAFVGVFWAWGHWLSPTAPGPFLGLLVEALRMGAALGAAFGVGALMVHAGLASREQARQTWVMPVLDFFRRYGTRTAWLLLALIGLYRISDIVLGVISNVFYQDMGFSKTEIAYAVKTFGVVVAIAGGFVGGLLTTRIGVMRSLFWGAVLAALTNLGFVLLAFAGHDLHLMYAVVAADNLAAGFASAAFVAFLSSLTNVSFTAVQYAIFSSLMTLLPKSLGGYSGGMVDVLGYPGFFTLTTLMGLPVLVLVLLAKRLLPVGR